MDKILLVIFSILIILIIGIFAVGYFVSKETINKCYPFPENVQGFECEIIKEEGLIKQTKFCTNAIIPSEHSCEVIYNSSDNKTKLTFVSVKFQNSSDTKECFDNNVEFLSKMDGIDINETQIGNYQGFLINGKDGTNCARIFYLIDDNNFMIFGNTNSIDNFLEIEQLKSLMLEFKDYSKKLFL